MITNEQLKQACTKILNDFDPTEPLICLYMSSFLYKELVDNYNADAKVITGSLSYKKTLLFEHKDSLNKINTNTNVRISWDGHCWVELDNVIIDLSIFRTIFSDKFNKECKKDIIKQFGTSIGCQIANEATLVESGFIYKRYEELRNDIIFCLIESYKLTTKEERAIITKNT